MHTKLRFNELFKTFILGFCLLMGTTNCADRSDSTIEQCSIAITSDDGSQIGINVPSVGKDEVAQSFQLTSDTVVDSVHLKLVKVGTALSTSATLGLRIETSSGAAPSGSLVSSGASATLSPDSVNITSSAQFYTFTLSSSVTLSANQTYWIRLLGQYTASETDHIAWKGTKTDVLTTGNAVVEDSPNSFTAHSTIQDLLFKIGCSTSN